MLEVKNPYLSVEISEKQFSLIKDGVRRELQSLGFEDIQELNNPHISIAYILGTRTYESLYLLAGEIADGPFTMNVNGIKAIPSEFYNGTIISLALEHTDDFVYVQEYVKECVITDESVFVKNDFPGGFQAHISLFVLKNLDEETIDLLPKYLEIALANIKTTIIGEKFSIYNGDRERLVERVFTKKDPL